MSGTAHQRLCLTLFVLAVLTACGGSGGGGSPAAFTAAGPQIQILTITTASNLPGTLQGHAYSTTLSASGGQGALHWSIAPVSTSLFVTGLAIDANTGVLSGTANFTGTAAFTATVTDSESPVQTATKNFTLNASSQLAIQASNSLDATQYLSTLRVGIFINGGVAPFKVSLDPVCLPPGMKPNPANASTADVFPQIVLGAALAAGTYTCNVTVQDSFSPPELASQVLTIRVAPPNLAVGGTVPEKLLVNRPMSARVFAMGGIPPYTLKQGSANLPAGVSFDVSTGQVKGTPTSLGAFSLSVTASDSSSPARFASQLFNITVVQPIGRNDSPATATALANNGTFPIFAEGSISPYIDPPNGTASAGDHDYYVVQSLGGAAVHLSATSTNALGPLDTVIEIVDGNGQQFATCRQPGDTSQNFNTGCVNDDIAPGVRNSALDFQVPGASTATTNFYVHVLDWRGDARPDMIYSLTITGTALPLQIVTPSSLGGIVGFGLAQPLGASGGTGRYVWSISSGTLPPGVTLQSNLLIASGPFTTTGTYIFDIKVDDAGPPPQSATKTITFTVGTPLQVTTTSLPQGKVATAYSATIATTGGVAPLSFTLQPAGWLPPGLTMDSTTGIISGTPTTAGSFAGIVIVQDVAQQQQLQGLTVVVNP